MQNNKKSTKYTTTKYLINNVLFGCLNALNFQSLNVYLYQPHKLFKPKLTKILKVKTFFQTFSYSKMFFFSIFHQKLHKPSYKHSHKSFFTNYLIDFTNPLHFFIPHFVSSFFSFLFFWIWSPNICFPLFSQALCVYFLLSHFFSK